MNAESTNLVPPWLGQGYPTYPHVLQVARVHAPAVLGTNVYPCYVAQFTPPLSLRDREPAYLLEPNNVRLGPGYYVGRLVGSYADLPLYVTFCCPVGSSSSAASSASPAGPPPVLGLPLGQAQTTSGLNLTLPNLSLAGGSLLLAVAGVLGTPEGFTATFGGTGLNLDVVAALTSGSPLQGAVGLLSLRVDPARSGDLLLHAAGGTPAALTLQAVQVSGLDARALDRIASRGGLATAPGAGATLTTTAPKEYALGAFALVAPTPGWAWQNGFASGGQDASLTVLGVAAAVTEGYRVLGGLTAVDAALAATVSAWAGACATYR
jgi:hypothetical protein